MDAQTRVDISLIGVSNDTPKGYRPYWNGRAFEMRDPKSEAGVPEPEKNTELFDKAGVYEITVPTEPDAITMVDISGVGGSGGGGAGGIYSKDRHYNGASGGGGGSSAVEAEDGTVLFEIGGGSGGNGGLGQSQQPGGVGGKSAVAGREMRKVTPGTKLRIYVGAGGEGGKHWGTPIGNNGGTNKGGAGGAGKTSGKKGDDGTIPGFPRGAGDGGGPSAGIARGQSLQAYNGTDGGQVGDTRGLVPANGGRGGAGGSLPGPNTDGATGNPGFIRLSWMVLPKLGVAQYARYVAKNGSVVEVVYDPTLEAYLYRLSGTSAFKTYTGVETEYSEPTYGQAWRTEGEKVKIKKIENLESDVWIAVATPTVLSADKVIGLKKTAGVRLVITGWDAFYGDRFEWTVDFLNSDFGVL